MEAPFLSTVSRTLPSSYAMLLVMLRAPSNLTKPSVGLLSQSVRQVFLLFLPPLLSSLLDDNGEGPAFVSPLAAHF